MKKTLLFSALCAVVLSLAGCMKSDGYHHQASVFYPNAIGAGEIFADQTIDSVGFISTDPWTIALSGESWLSMREEDKTTKYKYQFGYYAITMIPVYFQQNTTGKYRDASMSISVNGADDFSQVMKVQFRQYPCHKLTNIPMTQKNGECIFTRVDNSKCVKDSLIFTAFMPWTLECDNASFELSAKSGPQGPQKVVFTMPENTTKDTIRSMMKIISADGNVVTPINIKQAPEKK